MIYSDTATKQGIIQDITFLLGVDTTQYKIEDRTRNINLRFHMIWEMIFESYGGWKFHDDNDTGTPYADQTLTSGTGTYTIPSGALTIRFLEIKDSSGVYHRLTPLSEEEFKAMGADAGWTTSGFPEYYLLYGDTIKILPTPNFTVSSTGLRVYFDPGITEFATTDTSVTPGFATPFHRMLSIGGALDYAMREGQRDQVVYLQNLWNDYERRLRDFYAKRFQDRYPHKIESGVDLMAEFR